MSVSEPSLFEITGVQRGADGKTRLVEVECRGQGARLAFAQGGVAGMTHPLCALVVDGAPLVVASAGERTGCLVFDGRLPPHPLPAGADLDGDELTEARAIGALRHLLPLLADGLYSITYERLPPPRMLDASWSEEPLDASPRVVDPGPLAPDEGEAVVADLVGGWCVLLGGRGALLRGGGAFVVSAGFVVEAPGFEARQHDRGAREAFGRSPRSLLDDAALRDAWAAHRRRHQGADVGPLTEDRIEPAAQQARAVLWDLRAEEGVESAGDVVRERVARTTEFRAPVRALGRLYDVALVSPDGRHLHEAVVRTGPRFRATGLKPSGRAIARCLRALATEQE